jgi:hypothetical protein
MYVPVAKIERSNHQNLRFRRDEFLEIHRNSSKCIEIHRNSSKFIEIHRNPSPLDPPLNTATVYFYFSPFIFSLSTDSIVAHNVDYLVWAPANYLLVHACALVVVGTWALIDQTKYKENQFSSEPLDSTPTTEDPPKPASSSVSRIRSFRACISSSEF